MEFFFIFVLFHSKGNANFEIKCFFYFKKASSILQVSLEAGGD
jgi:hypothetical protein